MKIKRPGLLVFSVAISHLAGVIGSVFTAPSIATWYAYLNKPSFSPPNWLFAPVWLTLYTLIGVALYLVQTKKNSKFAVILFIVHLVFNSFWSIAFFGMKDIGLALAVIIFLWGLIAYLIKLFCKIDKRAAYLMIPYLLWVSFATLLNFSTLQLN